MTTDTLSKITILGWYQIAGGALGILQMFFVLLTQSDFSALVLLIYLFMSLFFAYSIFCGFLCIKQRDRALSHTLINQFLQLIGFAFFGYAFRYVAGIYFGVGLDLSESLEFKLDAGISKFDFNFNREHERADFTFNLVAFAIIYWIDKTKTSEKKQQSATIAINSD